MTQTAHAEAMASGTTIAASIRDPRVVALAWLVVMLAIVAIAAASSGAVRAPISSMIGQIPGVGSFLGLEGRIDPLIRDVIWQVRLPRVALSMLAGAGLAVAGAVMQAMFRNPLAEPGLIGVSMGGALGAVAAIVIGATGMMAIAPAAFAGSLVATAAAWQLGRRQHGATGVLLAGIAINASCASLIGLFTWHADDAQLRSLTFWNMGSLAGASWPMLAWLGPWVIGLAAATLARWRALNALLLGEREARHLGYPPEELRRVLVVMTALLVGPLVAVTGTIGFVGLVVPHLVRLCWGADHRWLLPASALAGALALAVADWLARIVVMPAELPVGVITSLAGGPFLLWLLARSRR